MADGSDSSVRASAQQATDEMEITTDIVEPVATHHRRGSTSLAELIKLHKEQEDSLGSASPVKTSGKSAGGRPASSGSKAPSNTTKARSRLGIASTQHGRSRSHQLPSPSSAAASSSSSNLRKAREKKVSKDDTHSAGPSPTKPALTVRSGVKTKISPRPNARVSPSTRPSGVPVSKASAPVKGTRTALANVKSRVVTKRARTPPHKEAAKDDEKTAPNTKKANPPLGRRRSRTPTLMSSRSGGLLSAPGKPLKPLTRGSSPVTKSSPRPGSAAGSTKGTPPKEKTLSSPEKAVAADNSSVSGEQDKTKKKAVTRGQPRIVPRMTVSARLRQERMQAAKSGLASSSAAAPKPKRLANVASRIDSRRPRARTPEPDTDAAVSSDSKTKPSRSRAMLTAVTERRRSRTPTMNSGGVLAAPGKPLKPLTGSEEQKPDGSAAEPTESDVTVTDLESEETEETQEQKDHALLQKEMELIAKHKEEQSDHALMQKEMELIAKHKEQHSLQKSDQKPVNKPGLLTAALRKSPRVSVSPSRPRPESQTESASSSSQGKTTRSPARSPKAKTEPAPHEEPTKSGDTVADVGPEADSGIATEKATDSAAANEEESAETADTADPIQEPAVSFGSNTVRTFASTPKSEDASEDQRETPMSETISVTVDVTPVATRSRPRTFGFHGDTLPTVRIESPPYQSGVPTFEAPPSPTEPITPRGETVEEEWSAEKLAKNLDTRRQVVHELFTTEESYLHGLDLLCSHFVEPLRSGKDAPHFSPQDISDVFSNIELIANLNRTFLADLKRVGESDLTAVANVMKEFAQYFRMYNQYLSSYDTCLRTLQRLQGDKKFQSFLMKKALEGQEIKENLNLTSLLILPVQRIPRYELLLREFLRRSPNDDPDREALQAAFDKVHSVAQELNEKKRQIEQMQVILEVQNDITQIDWEDIDSSGAQKTFMIPSRRLMRRGGVDFKEVDDNVVSSPTASSMPERASTLRSAFAFTLRRKHDDYKQRDVLLFNDILVWVSTARKYKGCMRLAKGNVEEVVDPSRPQAHGLLVSGTKTKGGVKVTIMLSLETKDEQEKWQADIERSIGYSNAALKGQQAAKELRRATIRAKYRGAHNVTSNAMQELFNRSKGLSSNDISENANGIEEKADAPGSMDELSTAIAPADKGWGGVSDTESSAPPSRDASGETLQIPR